jgi:hypothetical protein
VTLLGWLTDGARDHAPELLLTILLVTVLLAVVSRVFDPDGP